MKILATGDWHIGKVSHGCHRDDEHRHFLDWLRDEAVSSGADVLLVTGDVFDGKDPTPTSQQIYYSFLDDISEACPDMSVVIIAGNHDNPTLLEAPQSLLKRHRVEVRGVAEGCEQEDQANSPLILPVDCASGDRAWIIAVPYLRRSDFRFDQSYEKSVAGYLSALARAAKERRKDGEPIVMMAHLYAAGTLDGNDIDRSETIFVGGEPEIQMTSLTEHPDFLVSGHIHKRMNINGVPWARYTGSALPMSFAETGYRHGADLLTFTQGYVPRHEFLEYTPLSRFLSYGPASPDEIAALIEKDSPRHDGFTFIEAKVRLDSPDPDVRTRLEDIADKTGSHLVFHPEIGTPKEGSGEYATISRPEDLSSDKIVREVISRRFAAVNNAPEFEDGAMSDEERAILETIISKARSGDE